LPLSRAARSGTGSRGKLFERSEFLPRRFRTLTNGVFSAAWLPFILVLFFGQAKKRMGSPQGLPVVVVFQKIVVLAKSRENDVSCFETHCCCARRISLSRIFTRLSRLAAKQKNACTPYLLKFQSAAEKIIIKTFSYANFSF
jgi:hypothetical protein